MCGIIIQLSFKKSSERLASLHSIIFIRCESLELVYRYTRSITLHDRLYSVSDTERNLEISDSHCRKLLENGKIKENNRALLVSNQFQILTKKTNQRRVSAAKIIEQSIK